MRTEIKIGVAAAGFIALVAVLYFVLLTDWDSTRKKSPTGTTGQGGTAERPQIAARTIPPVTTTRPSEDLIPSGALPAGPRPGPVAAASPHETVAERTPLESGARMAVRTPPPSPPRTEVVASGRPEDTGAGLLRLPEAGSDLTGAESAGGAAQGTIVDQETSKERVYTVQEGDLGFWLIAKKMYGSGDHWKLIRDANPGVESESLKVGQKIKIPPLPEKAIAVAEPVGATAAEGRQTYVVQKGDNGFWQIAEKAYGNGTLWRLIADANPGTDSASLKAGQRLVIPPRPELPRAPAVAAVRGAAAAGAGAKTYVVKQGDAGFWTVAANAYGNGKYWPIIAEANPGVDPNRLRAGMELVVPELTDRVLSRAGSPSVAGPVAPAAPAGRPRAAAPETMPSAPVRPVFD
jgi:nucleoid-associated protein YgaU